MKPVVFDAEMNAAVRRREKTSVRYCIKYRDGYKQLPVPSAAKLIFEKDGSFLWELDGVSVRASAPYRMGEILYVRETYAALPVRPDGSICNNGCWIYYKADGDLRPRGWRGAWKASLSMPKEMARTFLKVTGVRAERLQDAFLVPRGSEAQIIKEGFRTESDFIAWWEANARGSECNLYGFDANPWVWVITFELSRPDLTD